MPLTSDDIDAVCQLVNDLCGICLDGSKAYLIESRLAELVKRQGCANYVELANRARSSADRQLKNQVVDAITTNETLFFRDGSPFEALKHKALPEVVDNKAGSVFPKRIRIWSAACSTGQEAYSIAMTLCELLPDVHNWDIQILGSDISDAVVAQASRGWYAPHEIERGMTRDRLSRFFQPDSGGWRVRDDLRSLLTFERKNLLEPLGMSNRFDVVFCRNVAIYFTPEVRRELFSRVAATLTTRGYLFVGSQESLSDLGPRFTPLHHCRASYYQPNTQLALASHIIAN